MKEVLTCPHCHRAYYDATARFCAFCDGKLVADGGEAYKFFDGEPREDSGFF